MIHEIRTYDLKAGAVPEFLQKTGELINKRLEYSPLVGFFYTEVGPLNRVVHIWQYEDLNQRTEVRAQVVKDGVWPPDNAGITVRQQSDICLLAPFLPKLELKRDIGPLFELRSYVYPPNTIPQVIDAWAPKIEARMELSEPVGIWYSDIGGLNKWMHMWSYESYEARTESRKKFSSIGWPPSSGVSPVSMENMLLHAADFSPVQ